jgi:hypothetical protein
MTFKSPLWKPVAVVLSVVNIVAVGFAASTAEPWHAGVHAGLGLVFGLWAQNLWRRGAGASATRDERLELIEGEVGSLRQELMETQERLDFAERVLAQGREQRRLGPEG